MSKRMAWCIFLMSCCVSVHASILTALVVHHETDGEATVQCDFSGPFRYHLFRLTAPDRVVIDFLDTTTHLKVADAVQRNGFIARVRAGQQAPNTLRLVFDVSGPVNVGALVKTASSLRVKLMPLHLSAKTHAAPLLPVQRAPLRSFREVVIVLDPGHGGHDPGAIGPNHHVEKHVVLAMAKMLKQLIDKQPGMRAVLTRRGDYYVGLRERLVIARK